MAERLHRQKATLETPEDIVHPILFRLGPLTVRYYGLMYVLALLVAIGLLRLEAKRRGLPSERMVDAAFYVFLGGLIGGRLYYVLFNLGYYGSHPLQIFAVWQGGMAIHGGLIGGLVGGWWYARVSGLPCLTLYDMAAPAASLGHAFGRFGNFMNGDAHGYPLGSPALPGWLQNFPVWMGVTFPPTSIAGREFGPVPLHPVMLYEMGLNLVGFVLLWSLRKRPWPPGGLLGLYLMYYAVVRSFTSLFRADDLYLGAMRMPHVISLVMFAVGLWLVCRRHSRSTAAS
ncbi:Phosphatidylglycerol--prolipoprotein diacylglyceryl transferase [Candidatus Entotheonellaceae bacterium PAL068K]